MLIIANIIPMTLEKLQDENKELRCTLEQKEETILSLEEQLAWLKRHVFGKRSERCLSELNSEQLTFAGFETLNVENKEPQSIASHQRQKPQRKGQDSIKLSPDLPVKTVILDIPEEEKLCKETGTLLVQIGTEVTHKLAHEPGSYYIKEIIRPKYAHPQRPEDGIVNAFLPDSIISKCRADDSLLAEIITKKFSDHLPLYRIAEGMGREGVIISRKLLSQWVIRCGMALKPLYQEMKKQVLNSKTIFIDESPVKLQAKDKCKTAFMWVVVGGNEANPAYRIYDFRENRCHHNVLDILKDYRNVLHSDKYAAYQRLAEKKIITWCPCFSHIRRNFFEAESGDPSLRQWILRKIRYLFMLE
ncbi:MAG: IS66 family transposase, partial [Verrucomicrobiota bacterium]